MQDNRMLENDCCEAAAVLALSFVCESSHGEEKSKKKRQRVESVTGDASAANK